MTNVNPLLTQKFSDRSVQSINNLYFPDGKVYSSNNQPINIITDVGSSVKVDDFLKFDVYYDYNRDKEFSETDKLAYTLYIFISKDGNKVKEAYESTKPGDDEIILFLEDNESDFLSEAVMYGRASANIVKNHQSLRNGNSSFYNFLENNEYYKISHDKVFELLTKGYIEDTTIATSFVEGTCFMLNLISLPVKGLGWVLEKIGEGVDLLKIEDKFWDTESEEYVFSEDNLINFLTVDDDTINEIKSITESLKNDPERFEWNDLIPGFVVKITKAIVDKIVGLIENYNAYIAKFINELYKSETFKSFTETAKKNYLQEVIALRCGIYNGLVDFISSTIKFAGSYLQTPSNIFSSWEEIKETIDNFINAISTINWEEVSTIFKGFYEKIKSYFKKNEAGDYNWVRIAYVSGFGIAFIATFFVPYANIAKIGTIGTITSKVQTLTADLVQTLNKVFVKATTAIGQKTAQGFKAFLKMLQKLGELFAKGGKKLKQLLDGVWETISKWFLKGKEEFETLVSKAKKLLKRKPKKDALYRDIYKKLIIPGKEGMVSVRYFNKVAKETAEIFETALHLVDRNSEEFNTLFKRWYKNPIHGVFHQSTFLNKRYKLVLEGPAIYFFQGVSGAIVNGERLVFKITYYTLQHELLHLKLWYKMTREFPELKKLYDKIPRWLHEADVIGEILKQNAHRKGKWLNEDIINDVNALNGILENNTKYRKQAKKMFGKEQFNKDDFKNWDLSKYLDKLD
ncbi:hypothetical protein NBRC110019_19840 [Neptunitalea chrysea]|uniref:Uncharacterized protein n=1 Tax=Neptunitalea chrysea TaxID=1647581 RepID=A0A9W6B5G3_9FLAO|nr:hypothetical protein [Neptunitalea chrysea]GLB52944.1 hypothetical protein NBRC110019_19840 [Neptunitalea chrysea]